MFRRAPTSTHQRLTSPLASRIAYTLTDKTVLRAGFGISYFTSGYDATFYHLTSFYPIVAQQTINQVTTYSAVFPLNQAPPSGAPPAIPSSGILPAPAASCSRRVRLTG